MVVELSRHFSKIPSPLGLRVLEEFLSDHQHNKRRRGKQAENMEWWRKIREWFRRVSPSKHHTKYLHITTDACVGGTRLTTFGLRTDVVTKQERGERSEGDQIDTRLQCSSILPIAFLHRGGIALGVASHCNCQWGSGSLVLDFHGLESKHQAFLTRRTLLAIPTGVALVAQRGQFLPDHTASWTGHRRGWWRRGCASREFPRMESES